MYELPVTIFTPTYNRAYLIERLYKDLINQTSKDFEWVIVDDGSSDNTEEVIEKFIKENILDIKYFKKENGGKHTAINYGVDKARGELFFIVDSDDGLLPDSVETVINLWNENKNIENISGISGLCIYENGDVIGTEMPDDKPICKFADLYFKYNVKGDKTLVLKTDILKKYKFPEPSGIKFLPESVVWFELSKYYTVRCINKPMIIREYLEDGLTYNMMSTNAVRGKATEFMILINQQTYPITRYPYMWIKNYINRVRYSKLAGFKYLSGIDGFFNKFMCILMYPLGYYKYVKTRDLVKHN
ncbi:glycosyltransferase family 2 protein [Peptacetobacter hominis]|uniref:Glycosyltransferase family 2 protein n=1 Tax=Peptacetobacter hominis TaxID=2743610 RepID=A0A544QTC1_9FIRM|nr:glycosyltransferase family A protein [Peptacetobacter hominis]TQQ83942.1 glycosyltransferase family 2 protein [Peptacetobacter hominis]